MKVICTKDSYLAITKGKIYDAEESPFSKLLFIKDDYDNKSLYSKSNFEKLSDIRNEKLNDILK